MGEQEGFKVNGNCPWCDSVGVPVQSPCASCEEASSCDAPHKGFVLCKSCYELYFLLIGEPDTLVTQIQGMDSTLERRD